MYEANALPLTPQRICIKHLFKSNPKKVHYLEKLIFSYILAKNEFFTVISKLPHLRRNVVILDVWIIWRDLKKDTFLSKYWYFCIYEKKLILKNQAFLSPKWLCINGDMNKKRIFKNGIKKRPLSQKVDIFVYIGKKRIFQSDLKITSYSVKCWYQASYGQKTNFSKWSQNNNLFCEMLILSELLPKNDFFKMISK